MQTESGAGAPGTVAAPLRHAAGERLLPLRAELVGHRHLARKPGLDFFKISIQVLQIQVPLSQWANRTRKSCVM